MTDSVYLQPKLTEALQTTKPKKGSRKPKTTTAQERLRAFQAQQRQSEPRTFLGTTARRRRMFEEIWCWGLDN